MNRQEWFPGLKEDDQESALDRAWETFLTKDAEIMAKNAGAALAWGKITLVTFGRECVIDPSWKSISIGGKELKPLAGMLILHYLTGAGPTRPTGKLIPYRQLPGGDALFPVFKKRVIEEIDELFHEKPQLLLSSMKVLGAKKQDYGDTSVLIHVFPKLPVTVILWRGDDEVKGSANVLFDETASKFMGTEDLASVGSFVVTQLLKAKIAVLREVNNINTT